MTAEILESEGGKHVASDFLLIPNMQVDDYGVTNEAFCQIFGEVPLDTSNDVDDFLIQAIAFCNDKLLGSLGCMILIDSNTFKANNDRVHQAICELNYGGIAINTILLNI